MDPSGKGWQSVLVTARRISRKVRPWNVRNIDFIYNSCCGTYRKLLKDGVATFHLDSFKCHVRIFRIIESRKCLNTLIWIIHIKRRVEMADESLTDRNEIRIERHLPDSPRRDDIIYTSYHKTTKSRHFHESISTQALRALLTSIILSIQRDFEYKT